MTDLMLMKGIGPIISSLGAVTAGIPMADTFLDAMFKS